MKKIFNTLVVVLITLIVLDSCQNVTIGDNGTNDGKVKVNISLNDFNYTIEEDLTRASDKTPAEAGVNRIALAVFNKDGEKVFSTTKNESVDVDDFDQISCTLYPGDYSFVVVAHKANDNSEDAAEIISADFAKIRTSKVLKTFAVNQAVTIMADQTNDVVIDMGKRVSSQFQLVTTDEQPDNVVICEIIINSSGQATDEYSINPTTGLALDNYQYKVLLSINKETIGSIKGKSIGEHCFVTDNPQIVDITVNMKDESGNVVKSRTFTDVPLQPYRVTRATGSFFNSSTKTNFSFDTTDDNVYEFQF